jgi:hypothetical protein
MNVASALFAAAFAIAGFAQAQSTDKFEGNWTVTWEGKSAILEANLEIVQDKGKWQTLARQKNDPCVGREVPIRVDERTDNALKMTLQFSEVIPGCKDAKVSLSATADGSVSGTRGGSELKLVRKKVVAAITNVQNVAAWPNHSLNRTHCGMRLKARHFILGL